MTKQEIIMQIIENLRSLGLVIQEDALCNLGDS